MAAAAPLTGAGAWNGAAPPDGSGYYINRQKCVVVWAFGGTPLAPCAAAHGLRNTALFMD